MQEVSNLRRFEDGNVVVQPSKLKLRSSLWKLLREKTECEIADSWKTAKVLVEKEIASYKV